MPGDQLFDTPEEIAHVDEDGVRRDRWGRYKIPHPVTGREKSWTRATTFAKSISDTGALERWGARLAVKGLMSRPDLQALVHSTSLDDKRELDKIVDQAKTEAGSKRAANLGTALHSMTETVDRGGSMDEVPEAWRHRVLAYQEAMSQYGIETIDKLIERVVILTKFEVAGKFDRIVRMPDGTLWIADLKTGENLKWSWSEIAIQLALYSRGDALYDYVTRKFEPMPEVNQDKALVIHLPTSGTQCDLYEIDIKLGWQAAELAYRVRNWRKRDKELAKLIASADKSKPSINWAERIQNAETVEGLSAIWEEADALGQWTDLLTRLGLRRKEEIESA